MLQHLDKICMKFITKFCMSVLILFLSGILSSCGNNPVTGRKEIQLVSNSREIHMGEENYPIGQQASGGVYSLSPEITKYVQEVGQKLTKHSNRPQLPYEFVVINSSVPNAWAMPGGKITINRGLLVRLKSESELAAVLGHEITHAALRHGAKSMERALLLQAGLLTTDVVLNTHPKTKNSSLTKDATIASAYIAALLVTTQYSQSAELEADRFGMDYMSKAGYSPMGAVKLQELFVEMSEKKERNWLKGLFASHPPSRKRLDANREYAKTLPGKFEGIEEFNKAIQPLKKVDGAYKAYDDGMLALEQKAPEDALSFANKAIVIEPKEALFYNLKGDALFKLGKYKEAIEQYTLSIEKNGDYYYPYEQRGKAYRKIGEKGKAKLDLKKSDYLYPNADGKKLLAELSEDS